MENWTEEEKAIAARAVAGYRYGKAAQERANAAVAHHLTLKVGDDITFRDMCTGNVVDGTVTRRGTVAGWAMVAGVETRFEASDLIL